MRRHHEVARPLPAAFHDVDLRRPAAVIGEHPERRPHADADRYLGADFEIAVLLGKPALRRQDARDIFVVEENGFQRRRGAAGDDRENAVLDLERIEAERRCFPSAIARIDIDLLLAVPTGLAPEVGAVAAPIARFRPGGAAGVMRRPSFRSTADGSSKSSWKVRCSDTEASDAGSGASMRRHFSPRMAVATCSVSLLVAPARSACANAGTAANRQPSETRARSINLSVSGFASTRREIIH